MGLILEKIEVDKFCDTAPLTWRRASENFVRYPKMGKYFSYLTFVKVVPETKFVPWFV